MDYDVTHPSTSFGVPETTQVVTPNGWAAIRDLGPGDWVLDDTGRSCRVRRLVALGVGRTCELGLRDGSSLVVGVGQSWRVQMGRADRQVSKVVTTAEVGEALAREVGVRLAPVGPVELPGIAPLPLAPYTLGALLANGGLSAPSAVMLWTVEEEIRRRVAAELPPGSHLSSHPARQPRCTGWRLVGDGCRNPILDALRELDLMGRRSFEKRIPERYLWGSVEDRLSLLRGMADGDGTVDTAGQVSYATSSPTLARDLVHLIRSLGGRCSLQVRHGVVFTAPNQPTARSGRPAYRVGAIRLPGVAPFALERKAERVRLLARSRLWNIRCVNAAGLTQLVSLDLDSGSGAFLADAFLPVQAHSAYVNNQHLAA